MRHKKNFFLNDWRDIMFIRGCYYKSVVYGEDIYERDYEYYQSKLRFINI